MTIPEILAALAEENYFPELDSLLIWYKGGVLYENYYGDFQANYLHEAQSVTKSIQSLLLGIAMDKGYLKKLDIPIKQFFREYAHLDWANGKDKITIEHLLTMQSGLQWNESVVPYHFIFQNDSNLMAQSEDWLEYALNKKMSNLVGAYFSYSSAAPILISKILQVLTGVSNEDFAREFLFEPLEIMAYSFQKNRKDDTILGDVDLLSSDLLKIGILCLQKGMWEGKRIVSEKWLKGSTSTKVKLNENEGYAYCWWTKIFKVGNLLISCYYAWGYGGQHIFVFEDLDLVVVTMAHKYDVTLAQEPFDLLTEVILKVLVQN